MNVKRGAPAGSQSNVDDGGPRRQIQRLVRRLVPMGACDASGAPP